MTSPPAARTELDQILARCLAPVPAVWQETIDNTLTAAAVLVPLLADDDGVDVILTVRASHLRHHSGQISLPGGRRDAQDSDPAATALRECEEEIGLERRAVKVLGGLNPLATNTGFMITPVVGLVMNASSIRPREREVAEVFRVPLDFLMAPSNRLRRQGVRYGELRESVEFPFQSHRIWGATARVLVDLCDCLGKCASDLSMVKIFVPRNCEIPKNGSLSTPKGRKTLGPQ